MCNACVVYSMTAASSSSLFLSVFLFIRKKDLMQHMRFPHDNITCRFRQSITPMLLHKIFTVSGFTCVYSYIFEWMYQLCYIIILLCYVLLHFFFIQPNLYTMCRRYCLMVDCVNSTLH